MRRGQRADWDGDYRIGEWGEERWGYEARGGGGKFCPKSSGGLAVCRLPSVDKARREELMSDDGLTVS